MSTKKKNEIANFDVSMAEAKSTRFTPSQCKKCKFRTGFSTCKIFGTKPTKYASVSENAPCPRREEKND